VGFHTCAAGSMKVVYHRSHISDTTQAGNLSPMTLDSLGIGDEN
jgi:hypothetical protein